MTNRTPPKMMIQAQALSESQELSLSEQVEQKNEHFSQSEPE